MTIYRPLMKGGRPWTPTPKINPNQTIGPGWCTICGQDLTIFGVSARGPQLESWGGVKPKTEPGALEAELTSELALAKQRHFRVGSVVVSAETAAKMWEEGFLRRLSFRDPILCYAQSKRCKGNTIILPVRIAGYTISLHIVDQPPATKFLLQR